MTQWPGFSPTYRHNEDHLQLPSETNSLVRRNGQCCRTEDGGEVNRDILWAVRWEETENTVWVEGCWLSISTITNLKKPAWYKNHQ